MAASLEQGPLARAYRRARLDPVASLIAAAARLGLRFRLAGGELVVRGAAALCPSDRELFARLGDLIYTGPTGTNVGDLQIVLLA